MAFAYKTASQEARKNADRQNCYYDYKVRYVKLEVGGRVLVKNKPSWKTEAGIYVGTLSTDYLEKKKHIPETLDLIHFERNLLILIDFNLIHFRLVHLSRRQACRY